MLCFEAERQSIKELEAKNRQLQNEIRALTTAASTRAATQKINGRIVPLAKTGHVDAVDGESKAGSGKQQERKPLVKAETIENIDDYVVLPKSVFHIYFCSTVSGFFFAEMMPQELSKVCSSHLVLHLDQSPLLDNYLLELEDNR